METLERQVRDALIEKAGRESYETMQKFEYKTLLKDLVKDMLYTAIGTFFAEEEKESKELRPSNMPAHIVEELDRIDAEFDAKMMQDFEEEADTFLEETLNNPEAMRKMAYDGARNQYMTREELEETLQGWYKRLGEDADFCDKAMDEFKKANQRLYRFFEFTDSIVAEYVKIAEEEGIEKVTTKEAEQSVMRRLFPTAEQFIEHCLMGREAFKEYAAHVERAMMMDGPLGKTLGSVVGKIPGMIDKIKDVSEKMQDEYVFKKAEEIYGKDMRQAYQA
jgi:isoleucyl-tRNA synthetase